MAYTPLIRITSNSGGYAMNSKFANHMFLGITLCFAALICGCAANAQGEKSGSEHKGVIYRNPRVYNIECSFEMFPDPNKIDRGKDLKLWVPIPREWDSQKAVKIISVEPEPHAKYVDPEYGNPMLFWDFGKEPEKHSYKVNIKYRLEQYEVHSNVDPNRIGPYDKISKDYILYTQSTRTISITDKVKELADIAVGDEENPYLQAKRIFELVRKKMRYQNMSIRYDGDSSVRWLLESSQIDQKTGEEYYQGNCHDYSAFLTALCRAAGIPARTVYALIYQDIWIRSEDSEPPVKWKGGRRLSPDGLASLRISGFGGHGWAEIYLPNYGWIPIDAQRGTFGNLENRYVIASKGHDIKIGPNTPEKQSEGYGTTAILLREGRADRLDWGLYNIAEIHDAAFQGLNYLEPSIHVAARVGGLAKVKAFLKNGVDVNARDPDGYTPLQFAVQSGQEDVVELLIAKGADVNVEDDRGETPLHDAAAKGHKEVAELLIAKGADIDAKKPGYTPLYWAIWNEDRDMIKLLVANGADVNFVAEDDWPFLHYLTDNNDRELVELLLAHGAKLNVKDENGWTEFRLAVSEGHLDLARFLVSKGATAPEFHLAACLGDLDRVKGLVEKGTNVDTKDKFGWTPLYWAVSTGQEEVAEFLISKGASIDATTNNNRTHLHQAAMAGAAKLVELLISKGAGSNARTKNDSTPLHSAASGGHKNVVELLIANGAEAKAKEKSGETPLHKASTSGHVDVVEILLANGADVDAKGRRGRTALQWAKQRGHTEIVELLRKHGAKE